MTIAPDNIPELSIEFMDDQQGRLILLEQNSGGNIDRVAIHPIQLRYLAEKFGLIETSDPQAEKTIAALKRRLLVLRDRAEHMAYWLTNHSDHRHADLSHELTYAAATSDIADEFCAELTDRPAEPTVSLANSASLLPMTTPKPTNAKQTASPQPSLI